MFSFLAVKSTGEIMEICCKLAATQGRKSFDERLKLTQLIWQFFVEKLCCNAPSNAIYWSKKFYLFGIASQHFWNFFNLVQIQMEHSFCWITFWNWIYIIVMVSNDNLRRCSWRTLNFYLYLNCAVTIDISRSLLDKWFNLWKSMKHSFFSNQKLW